MRTNFITFSRGVMSAAAAICLAASVVNANENFDFSSANSGFRVESSGSVPNPWTYGAYSVTPGGGNSWYTLGNATPDSQSPNGFPAVSYLISPLLRVQQEGQVWGSFLHRFNFEVTSGTNWDGGQFQYRINQTGAWLPVSMLFGETYNGTVVGNNVLNGQRAFTGASSGNELPFYVQTRFELGVEAPEVFRANDLLEFRFAAAWDEFTIAGAPNWQLGNMILNNLVVQPIPEPSTGVLAAIGGFCLLLLRRRS